MFPAAPRQPVHRELTGHLAARERAPGSHKDRGFQSPTLGEGCLSQWSVLGALLATAVGIKIPVCLLATKQKLKLRPNSLSGPTE